MKIVNICACNDWFFVHEGSQGQLIVLRIAAWGINEQGDVLGLVSHQELGDTPLKIVPVPPLPGAYKHKDELTEEQMHATQEITKIPE